MTHTKDEALKLALEALESLLQAHYNDNIIKADCLEAEQAITALKQALAAPVQERPPNCGTSYCSCIECIMPPAAQPAPVAWMYELIIDGEVCNVECTNVNWNPEYQPFGRAGIDFVEGGKVTKTPLVAAHGIGEQK
jgi:hypothetical protein